MIAIETWIFLLSECLKWCWEGGTWKNNQLDLIEKILWEIRSCTFEINFLGFSDFCVFSTENRFDEMTCSYLAFTLISFFWILIFESPGFCSIFFERIKLQEKFWKLFIKSSHQYSTTKHIVDGIIKRIEEKTF